MSRLIALPGRKRYRGLAATLTVTFIILLAVVLVLFNGLNIYNFFRNNREIIIGRQELMAKEPANTVKSFIQEKLNMMAVTAGFDDLLAAPEERQRSVLSSLMGQEPSFRQLVLLDNQGKEVSKISRYSSLVAGVLNTKNLQEAFTRAFPGEEYISPIIIDETSFEPMVIMAVPLTDIFGDSLGVLVAEVNLKFMWDLIGALKIGEKGQVYVVDEIGNLVASRDITRVLKGENLRHLENVAAFVSKKMAFAGRTDIGSGIMGTRVIASLVPLGKPDWAVVAELPLAEAYRPVQVMARTSLFFMLISLGIAIIAGVVLVKRITKPVADLGNALRELGKGNLRTKITVARKDEFGELAAYLNKTIGALSLLITKARDIVKMVSEQSYFLKESSEQSVESAETVAVTMEEISMGTIEQTKQAERASLQIDALAKEIDIIVAEAKEVEGIAGTTRAASYQSKEALDFLVEKTKETDRIIKEFEKSGQELNESIQAIRSITDTITKITEKTHLLAVNAAIEAARAGEAGRGFGVVASEIGKLGRQSREAAEGIEEILKRVQEGIRESVRTSEEASQMATEQTAAVFSTREAFDNVISAMDETGRIIMKMNEIIKRIDECKDKAIASIVSVNAICEETAAASEEVTAVAEEQKAGAEHVKGMADTLHKIAGDLVSVINTFQTRGEREDETPVPISSSRKEKRRLSMTMRGDRQQRRPG
ncbi:MAG: methyl-accepting chemotaxis protein [Firmicutes bacterium]|nr:methyl-accepting chemotaxis protein [Bacillota bacterium]